VGLLHAQYILLGCLDANGKACCCFAKHHSTPLFFKQKQYARIEQTGIFTWEVVLRRSNSFFNRIPSFNCSSVTSSSKLPPSSSSVSSRYRFGYSTVQNITLAGFNLDPIRQLKLKFIFEIKQCDSTCYFSYIYSEAVVSWVISLLVWLGLPTYFACGIFLNLLIVNIYTTV
jgi:hypothetical protein